MGGGCLLGLWKRFETEVMDETPNDDDDDDDVVVVVGALVSDADAGNIVGVFVATSTDEVRRK